MNLLDL